MSQDQITVGLAAEPADSVASVPLAAGSMIGHFRIDMPLGAGGMGMVYLASQTEPVQRRVAVKLLRNRSRDALAIARFQVERQSLALLQHPAIAQVFDAGTTDDGHPWLAMEYIEGRTLTEFARSEQLSTAQILRLFVRVCQGVQHAHQRGLIHRDLKPSNVLALRIDGEPTPKIIDFGIAVSGTHDSSGAARAVVADLSGTYGYMSPEQTRGERELDTRVDVFALGVMLAELLTGEDAASRDCSTQGLGQQITAAVRLCTSPQLEAQAGVDAQLSTLLRQLPIELRWMLQRATEEDRERRYSSAAAFADDIERYLQHRPLAAAPPSSRYVLGKFVRRHRLSVTTASVALLALLIGSALAWRGQRAAEQALAMAEAAAARAEVESRKSTAVSEFVSGIFRAVDPDLAQTLDTQLLRRLIDDAAHRANTDLAAQPAVQSGIHEVLADAYAALGDHDRAVEHQAAAVAASEQAGEAAMTIARQRMQLASLRSETGDIDQQIAVVQELLAQLPASIAADDPQRLAMQFELAGMQCNAGQYQECYQRIAEVLAIQQRSRQGDPRTRIDSEIQLARAAGDLSRWDESEALHRSAITHANDLLGPDHTLTRGARNGLAVLFLKQTKGAQAEAELRELLPRYQAIHGAEHPETIVVASNLGAALRQQKRHLEAKPYYLQVVEQCAATFGPYAPKTVSARHNLGNLLRDLGELDAAEAQHRQAVAAAPKAFGENSTNLGQMHYGLGHVLLLQRRYREAETEFNQAWQVIDGALPKQHPRRLQLIDLMIRLYSEWPQPETRKRWEALRAE